MNRITKTLCSTLAAFLAPAVLADTFVFTAIPDQDERQLTERFGKIADYLEQQLEVEVQYIPVKSYSAAVSAFRSDQVQMAWFGGLTGVQARQLVPGSQAIAQGVEDTAFTSYFIAHESTGLAPADTLTDALRGKSFTFGSKGSTSGRLMPEFYLREQFGEAPETLFSRVGFSGDHSRTIALVESGAYDVGAVNYAVWDAGVEAGDIDTDAVQVIWETPAYPDYQWTIRGDVDARFGDGFTQRVQQALLDMTDPDLLAAFPRSGFVPATNADYAPIEATAVTIGIMDAQ
ncbi:MAG TPA: putative selenate ABC transporter substrate-binding protein [Saccharospirillum sp.]|nr:putative selenate ABC transporter substrate-binding protein [Saccharospirillum sp.]